AAPPTAVQTSSRRQRRQRSDPARTPATAGTTSASHGISHSPALWFVQITNPPSAPAVAGRPRVECCHRVESSTTAVARVNAVAIQWLLARFHTGTQITTTRSPATRASPTDARWSARKYVQAALSALSDAVVRRAVVTETPPSAYAIA